MNNNLIKELIQKIFRSGNPVFLYIGINSIVFLIMGLVGLIFYLGNKAVDVNLLVHNYAGLPAQLTAFPTRFYTLFIHMFFNEGFLNFLFTMLWLYWFGNIFMNFLKVRQFHVIFLGGGLIGAIFYLVGLNVFPVFAPSLSGATLIGASACVLAIVVATATLVPNYAVRLMIFGEIKIKYIALAYLIMDLIGSISVNAGNGFAHLGGAIFGFIFMKQLQKGNDWSKIFEPKPKLRVVKNTGPIKKNKSAAHVPQQEIDAILDKISTSGYDQLSASEKEKLFKASKN